MSQDEVAKAMGMSVDKLVEDLSAPKTRNNVVVEKPEYNTDRGDLSNAFSFTQDSNPGDISYPREPHYRKPEEYESITDKHVRAINNFQGEHFFMVNHVICTPIYTDTDPFDINALNASFDYTIGPVFSTFEPGPDGRTTCKPKEGHQTRRFAISDGKFYLGFGVQMDPVVRIGRIQELTPVFLHEKRDGNDDSTTAYMRAILEKETGPRKMRELTLVAKNYATLFPSKHMYEAWKHGDIVTVNDDVYPIVLSEDSVRVFVNGGKKVSAHIQRPVENTAPADVQTPVATWPGVQSENVGRNYIADAITYLRHPVVTARNVREVTSRYFSRMVGL